LGVRREWGLEPPKRRFVPEKRHFSGFRKMKSELNLKKYLINMEFLKNFEMAWFWLAQMMSWP
jgi:hypothetical protein